MLVVDQQVGSVLQLSPEGMEAPPVEDHEANGVVGMKPTIGLLSRNNVIAISTTFDTAGPLTRSVRDAARLLSVIAGSRGRFLWAPFADAWTRNRDLPAPEGKTFMSQWKAEQKASRDE